MHNVGIHFDYPKRRSISLTKAIVGSMKRYTGHILTHVFINTYINYDVAISGQKLTMQWRYTLMFAYFINLHECSIRIYLTVPLEN